MKHSTLTTGIAILALVVGVGAWFAPRIFSKPPEKEKLKVTLVPYQDESSEMVAKRWGDPLKFTVKDQSRTIYLYKGESKRDKEEETKNNKWIYYHDWLPAPLVNPTPLRGYPDIVWKTVPLGGKIGLTFRFVVSNDTMRNTFAVWLRHQNDHAFQQFAKEPSKAPKIEVLPLPATLCWFGISDQYKLDVLLADVKPFTKQAGDWLDVTFEFSPGMLTEFLDLYSQGRIVFQYAPLVRGTVVQRGYCSTKLDLQALNSIEHELNSANLPKGSRFTGSDGATYVTQNGYDHINREVFAKLRKEIVVDSSAAAQFVVQDPVLLGSCFEVTEISIAELSKLPTSDQQAVAEYLRPLLKQTVENNSTEKVKGNTETHEKGWRVGASVVGVIPPITFGASGGYNQRDLDTFYNATGVRYSKSDTKNNFEPVSLRVYKDTTANAKKGIKMSTNAVIGFGSIDGHSQYIPLLQSWTEPAVNKALETIRAKYQGYPTDRQADVLQLLQAHEKRLHDHQMRLQAQQKRIAQTEVDLINNKKQADEVMKKNVEAIVNDLKFIKKKTGIATK